MGDIICHIAIVDVRLWKRSTVNYYMDQEYYNAPINVKPHYTQYTGKGGGLALKTRPMGTFHHDHGKEGFGAV